jgi:3-oxoadipate enol-lactonase
MSSTAHALAIKTKPPQRKTGFLELQDARIYFEVTGTGPALVFAHGLAGNYLSWWQQIPVFANQYSCITFSHRLFTPSTQTGQGRGAAAFADDLRALLDHLNVDQAILVAQSMGGWTCLRFAVRSPERVRGLLLAATAGMTPSGADFLRGPAIDARQKEMSETLDAYRKGGIVPAAGARMLVEQPKLYFLYQAIDELTPRANKNVARDSFSQLPAVSREELAKIKAPTLLLTSDEDVVFAAPVADQLAKCFANARIERVQNAGHSIFFERAAEFNNILWEFCASLASPGTNN